MSATKQVLRGIFYCGLAVFSMFTANGCKKSQESKSANEVPPNGTPQEITNTLSGAETLQTFSWVGKEQLSKDSAAKGLMDMWNLPESRKLEEQTLNKLALSSFRQLPITNGQVVTNYSEILNTNSSGRAVRALLKDLLDKGFSAEAFTRGGHISAVCLRISADQARNDLWTKGLGDIRDDLRSLGWGFASTNEDKVLVVEISRLAQRERGFQVPKARSAQPGTNWIVGDLRIQGSSTNKSLHLSFSLSGDGQHVLMQGLLDGMKLNMPLSEEWLMPTNLMAHPLVGITCMRGISPLFQESELFRKFALQGLPNQLSLWNRPGPPVQFYFAAPTTNAESLFERIAPQAASVVNSNAPMERFGRIEVTNRAAFWNYFAYASPHLRVATNPTTQYLMGGFGVPLRETNQMPVEILKRLEPTNLVYFDWEVTGERLAQFRYLDDIARISLDAAHRPRLRVDSTSLVWASAVITNHLETASTEAYLQADERISFKRKSKTGFTAAELNLLMNWLEQPDFPAGFTRFFKIDATPPPPRPFGR